MRWEPAGPSPRLWNPGSGLHTAQCNLLPILANVERAGEGGVQGWAAPGMALRVAGSSSQERVVTVSHLTGDGRAA